MREGWLGTDHKELDKRDDLHKVLGWLRGDHGRRPIIADHKTPFAILDQRRLMGRGISAGTRLDKVAWPVPSVLPDDDEDAVRTKLVDAMAPYIPVRDDRGRAKGYVEAWRVAADLERGPPARQAWEEAPSVRAGQRIEEAHHVFATTIAGQIPVLAKDGRIEGALHRSEVLMMQEFEDQPVGHKDFGGEAIDVRRAPVDGRMVGGWAEVTPDTPFEDVVDLVGKAGQAFVLDSEGRYQGTVTGPSLLRRAVHVTSPSAPARTVSPHFRQG